MEAPEIGKSYKNKHTGTIWKINDVKGERVTAHSHSCMIAWRSFEEFWLHNEKKYIMKRNNNVQIR